jgi:hypothetical protein
MSYFPGMQKGNLDSDAWSVGNEPCVFVEFSRGSNITSFFEKSCCEPSSMTTRRVPESTSATCGSSHPKERDPGFERRCVCWGGRQDCRCDGWSPEILLFAARG